LASKIPEPIRRPEKVGPCGKVEAIQIPFANPDGAFPDREERLQQPKWFFEGISESSLIRFFNTCELRGFEKRLLMDKDCWEVTSKGCQIKPNEQLVWSLNPHSRAKIYSVLAKSSANYSQCYPFRFPIDGFEPALKDSGLPKKVVERLSKLTYSDAGGLCFADLRAAESMLKPSEFLDLVETLWAVPAYLLRLDVKPDSDIEGLIKYWGKGGREKFIAPLLNSVARVPGGGSINISYLLPPFARLRLYTYPDAWHDRDIAKEDCLVTALNFFNDTLDPNTFNKVWRENTLNSDYVTVTNEPSFGDLVTMLGAENEIFHACVYVANGFVYTKNGVNHAQPWMLMKMSDMLRMYSSAEKPGRLVFLRRKEGATTGQSSNERTGFRPQSRA
jgi:hypothetical protein